MNSKILKSVWALAFLLGLFCVGARFVLGKDLAASSSYVPWGLWVAVYVYLVGMSAGCFLLATAVYVLEIRPLEKVGKLALFLSFVTLVGGLATIVQDLGHPFRAWKVFTSPNLTSMMGWMIWLYTAYGVLLVVLLRLAFREDLAAALGRSGPFGWLAGLLLRGNGDVGPARLGKDRLLMKKLAFVGIPLTIGFSGGVGALFGVVGARPYWNSSIMPILFLVGALASGSALLTAVAALFWPGERSAEHSALVGRLAALVASFLGFYLLFEWAEFSINLYSAIPAEAEAYRLVLFGPFWWAFWVVHIGLGAIVPLALLLPAANRRKPGLVGLAAALVAVTFLAVRVNIVVPGLALEELKGLESAYRDFRLHFDYVPNLWEWGVAAFSFALVALLFHAGARNLTLLGDAPEQKGGAR